MLKEWGQVMKKKKNCFLACHTRITGPSQPCIGQAGIQGGGSYGLNPILNPKEYKN